MSYMFYVFIILSNACSHNRTAYYVPTHFSPIPDFILPADANNEEQVQRTSAPVKAGMAQITEIYDLL